MKYENGLWWPDSENHLNHFGINYQKEINQLALDLIPPINRKRFVDVGAHVGIYTLRNAQYFLDVDSFEPCPETYQCLKANVEGNSLWNVATYNFAVGADGQEEVSMKWNPENTGNSTPSYGAGYPCLPLDHYKFTDVSFIKIDVEGFEVEVLKGAKNTIDFCHPVIILEAKGEGILANDPMAPIRYLTQTHTDYILFNKVGNDYLFADKRLAMKNCIRK